MTKKEGVSGSVIKRLPRYYRFLSELSAKGIIKISSRELAEIMGTTASQIRQDLNCFGGFGQQGYGYSVLALQQEISAILGLEIKHSAILIGAGNLGKAIATHISFTEKGFKLTGIFDIDAALVGKKMHTHQIMHIDRLQDFCTSHRPDVAVLCIPKESACVLSGELVGYGIKAFWNFSHYDISLNYPDVAVENVHLGDSLMRLCYKITSANAAEVI